MISEPDSISKSPTRNRNMLDYGEPSDEEERRKGAYTGLNNK